MRVITFHGLGDPPREATQSEAQYWVDANRFRELMDRIVELDDYQITFDDGNRSDFDIATPILQERGLSATFFVLVDRLEGTGSLTASDIRSMAQAGMKIGSHGTKHRPWTELNRPELDAELSRSREVLSQVLGEAVFEAACPFGKYNRRVLRALTEHGYGRVYTSDGGWSSPNSFLVPRWTILRDDGPQVIQHLIRPSIVTAAWQQARYSYRRARAMRG